MKLTGTRSMELLATDVIPAIEKAFGQPLAEINRPVPAAAEEAGGACSCSVSAPCVKGASSLVAGGGEDDETSRKPES